MGLGAKSRVLGIMTFGQIINTISITSIYIWFVRSALLFLLVWTDPVVRRTGKFSLAVICLALKTSWALVSQLNCFRHLYVRQRKTDLARETVYIY